MKCVLQRVKKARVSVEGEVRGEIGAGFLILLGVAKEDSRQTAEELAEEIVNLRVMEEEGKMNLSLADVEGEALVVSQFTLLADTSKGRRPSFQEAADPEKAEELYLWLVKSLKEKVSVETGVFGAYMNVSLVNDGPVTIVLDTED